MRLAFLFVPALVLHVVVAVLGLGSILGIALVAGAARRARSAPADVSTWLTPLFRLSAISLGTMLVTGILMDAAAGGAFHEWWWFRGSVLLLVLTGILNGYARRVARRGLGLDTGREAALRSLERLGYGMSVLVATIATLMELKPF